MKKNSNNSKYGNIAIILNALIFVVFIVFLLTLRNFDKANVEYQKFIPTYTVTADELRSAQQPTRQDSVFVAQYQYRVDTMSTKAVPATRKEADIYKAELERLTKLLNEKLSIKKSNDSIVALKKVIFSPIESKYHELETITNNNKSTCLIWIAIFIIFVIIKIGVWAIWTYKNAKSIRNASSWAQKSTKPFWAWLGWIIPILNFSKPYAFLSELWDDTDYLLKDKNILPPTDKKGEYTSDLYIGLWWGLFLIALISYVFLSYTFFDTGALFNKLNHVNVMIGSAICWALYLTMECVVILKYNTLNKLTVENL